MILNRYIQRNMFLGTLGALFLLVALSLLFQFVRELDEVGQGSYDMAKVMTYVLLRAPGVLVEFLPMAVLLGSILSLGALAGNSEIIAMQASGVSLPRLLMAVLQAAILIAVIQFLVAEWVAPGSDAGARAIKNQALGKTAALQDGGGLWIKDENRVLRVERLLPGGLAQGVEIYQLNAAGKLVAVTRAARAIPNEDGWELLAVERSTITADVIEAEALERLTYTGKLSPDLLQVLTIRPSRMSSGELRAYLNFLDENQLDATAERSILWQKYLAPLTVVVMALLAFPFILGAQRQSNTGHRLLTGIILGLAFAVVDRLVFQLGGQLAVNAIVTAILPSLLFLALAGYLISRKLSHGISILGLVGLRSL